MSQSMNEAANESRAEWSRKLRRMPVGQLARLSLGNSKAAEVLDNLLAREEGDRQLAARLSARQ